jgi:chorismate synthase
MSGLYFVMSFSFGRRLRMTVFGESHGFGVGTVIDGCPPGFPLDLNLLQQDMDRRRPGQSVFTTLRKEEDKIEVFSGLFNGRTNGGALTVFVRNTDVQSSTYAEVDKNPRPGHLDYTAHIKYRGFFDYRGGGFLSGRITAPMVMAGGVAKQLLSKRGVRVNAYMKSIGPIEVSRAPTAKELAENTYRSEVRCPIIEDEEKMKKVVWDARTNGDSVGGVVEVVATGIPAGFGEPVFDSVESTISHALFSIPAVKGVEFGAGFDISRMPGSLANDQFAIKNGSVITLSNNNGGVLGGITNGMPIVLRVAFKPTASIPKPQKSVNLETMKETTITAKGRHDPCVAIRGVIVVENMVSFVLADLLYSFIENFEA